MTSASNGQALVVRTDRGLAIAGTRITLKSLLPCGVGILPAQIRTGKMPIPQDCQIKLHIAVIMPIALHRVAIALNPPATKSDRQLLREIRS